MADPSGIQVQFGPFDQNGNPITSQPGPWAKYAASASASGAQVGASSAAAGPWQKYAAAAPAERPNAMGGQEFDARFGGRAPVSTGEALGTGMAQGLTMNFADELGGALEGLAYKLHGKGTFAQGYDAGVNALRTKEADAEAQHPVASTVGQIAGALPMVALPLGDAAEGANLAARVGRGFLQGAGYGAVSGAGGAQGGVGQRALGAGEGALAGGITGAALPVASDVATGIAKPFVNAIKARVNPEGFAAQKVADTLARDKLTPDQAAGRMARASSYGNNLSVADVAGDNTHNLLRATTNVAGPAAKSVRTKVNVAQMAQGGRIKSAIGDYLADPGAYQATKEGIIADRSSAAAPYYKAAEARPIPYTANLENILNTPAGKAALASAKVNSLNRREPWAQWFASIDDNGNILDARRVPDTRALDEVQRTLRTMVEDAKKPADGSPFGRPMATPRSIAIQSVRDDLLKEMDRANPAFAKARSVGLDNIQADEAIEFGRNSLSEDPRVVAKQMAKYNDGQRQLAQIGAAEALRAKIEKAGFSADVIKRIFNSREQIAGLKALFADKPGAVTSLQHFMLNEARKVRTRAAVTGNSTTAKQLANMAEAGQAGEAVSTAGHLARGNVIPLVVNALRRVGGLTPQVADHIARMLMTAEPARARSIVDAVRRIEQAKITGEQRSAAIRGLLTRFAGSQEGTALAGTQRAQ